MNGCFLKDAEQIEIIVPNMGLGLDVFLSCICTFSQVTLYIRNFSKVSISLLVEWSIFINAVYRPK